MYQEDFTDTVCMICRDWAKKLGRSYKETVYAYHGVYPSTKTTPTNEVPVIFSGGAIPNQYSGEEAAAKIERWNRLKQWLIK